MSRLTGAARGLIEALRAGPARRIEDATRDYVELVTFASADEIVAMLTDVLAEDWMGLPPWARNLAYRLACLQRPGDAGLRRAAAADLLSFGPDWDDEADRLNREAAGLE